MKVGGKPVDDLDTIQILYMIKSLPSSFETRNLERKLSFLHRREVRKTVDSLDLASVLEPAQIQQISEALSISEQLAHVLLLNRLTFKLIHQKRFSAAVSYARQAVEVGEQLGSAPYLHTSYVLLHRAVRKQARELTSTGDETAAEELLTKLGDTRDRSSLLGARYRGAPVNKDAANVEMGQIAVSSKPMGSSGVRDCVALVAQADTGETLNATVAPNLVTHKTGRTDASQIASTLSEFANGGAVKVRLLGGNGSLFNYGTQNIIEIIEALRGSDANIVSADIGSITHASEFVVYPNFEMKEECPNLDYAGYLHEVHPYSHETRRPPRDIGDPQGPREDAYLLDEPDIAKLRTKAELNHTELQRLDLALAEAFYVDTNVYKPLEMALFVSGYWGPTGRVRGRDAVEALQLKTEADLMGIFNREIKTVEAYNAAIGPINQTFRNAAKTAGWASEDIEQYLPHLAQFCMYVGSGANEANGRLVHHLDNDFFDNAGEIRDDAFGFRLGSSLLETVPIIPPRKVASKALEYLFTQYGRQDLIRRAEASPMLSRPTRRNRPKFPGR